MSDHWSDARLPTPHDQEHGQEHSKCERLEKQALGVARVDGERQYHGEEDDTRGAMTAANDHEGGGEEPTRPGHDVSQWVTHPATKSAAQFEDCSSHQAGDEGQSKGPRKAKVPVPAIRKVTITPTVNELPTGKA